MTFAPFDPLSFKNTVVSEAALAAVRRELDNILSSYVGWFDPFSELVQNALDAVDSRRELEAHAGNESYSPKIIVDIDIDANTLTVTDNGVGLAEAEFQQFLAPSFSFKKIENGTRGHKGVGATYIAYGFNLMRIATKSPGFEQSGRIVGARSWLRGTGSAENPQVEPDLEAAPASFGAVDRGTSITVRFDETTTPGVLSWLKADTAATWLKILSAKTGIGSVISDEVKSVTVNVISAGQTTTVTQIGTGYLWLHDSAGKVARLRDIDAKADEFYATYGAGKKLPDKFSKLDFIYDSWTTAELKALVAGSLDEDDLALIEKYSPSVSVEFGYTAKFWTIFNKDLGIRAGQTVLTSGIQMAANNMPQGETILIPLIRNIGRQNQLHFLIHFDNYTPDLGRKGFHRELNDFAKKVARAITEGPLSKRRSQLKANTGASPDLARELAVADWKEKLVQHELDSPLKLTSPHFFAPTQSISITSEPTREQDVIALFHELIAGGVIRGISIMSTNEHSTYDGLFKVSFALDRELYVYDDRTNPLGVDGAVLDELHGRVTQPRVLEYKFSLDGLIEDFENNDKNINDIDLCIAWDTGSLYESRYGITSLLVPENADQRQYHGVTHVLEDMETGNKQCDLIILSELVASLNDPEDSSALQRVKYE
ncbi:Histidine kinase/HSP90-like ATPase domain-containing protein [Salinibacterium sp. NYA9b]